MREWHHLAKEMIDRGEPRGSVAALFRVSEAMVCKIAKMQPAAPIQVPEWVRPENRRAFRILAQERGKAIAIEWARKVQGP